MVLELATPAGTTRFFTAGLLLFDVVANSTSSPASGTPGEPVARRVPVGALRTNPVVRDCSYGKIADSGCKNPHSGRSAGKSR